MALYDGFFDAARNEDTGDYDRTYDSGDFTQYFGQMIGSGVCVHNAPDSFKVRVEDGAAVISPGYLFIQGYWLKNDEDYPVELSGDETVAITARLNLGKKIIELEARSVEQAYPDSLVLALVNPAAATAEDTRYNTSLCGVIEAAGELSSKVQYAVNYIDSEIDEKLAQIERDIHAQEEKLDKKIAEVQAVADSIVPLPVGTIKFSASRDVGPDWLRCDGSFVNEADYPELVAALGKLTPGVESFSEKLNGNIPMEISNGLLYDGRFWVFCFTSGKLYGISLTDWSLKEFSVIGADALVSPRTFLIYLSILEDGELFLAQHTASDAINDITVYCAYSLDTSKDAISVQKMSFSESSHFPRQNGSLRVVKAGETYYMAVCIMMIYGANRIAAGYYSWQKNDISIQNFSYADHYSGATLALASIPGFTGKNANGLIYYQQTGTSSANIESVPPGIVRGYNQSGLNVDTYKDALSVYSSISISDLDTNLMIKYFIKNKVLSVLSATTFSTDKPVLLDATLSLPSMSRVFEDACAYLPEQELWVFFVGTGLVFTRDLRDAAQYGFLNTQDTLGTITQFGYIEHDPTTNRLFIMGQDSANIVKLGIMDIPPLYNYANDGAWLPMLAADGVPAYISANRIDPVEITISASVSDRFNQNAILLFNGEALISGTYIRTVSKSGTFTVGVRSKINYAGTSFGLNAVLNGTTVVSMSVQSGTSIGDEKTATFKVSDYLSGGIVLSGIS